LLEYYLKKNVWGRRRRGLMAVDMKTRMSRARWGWLLTTLALGLALGIASWANYRSARDAVSTLDLGQVEVFEGAVMSALRAAERSSERGAPLPSLDSLVLAHADRGLRFVGTFSPQEGLTVLGGTPLPDPVEPPRRQGGRNLVRIGDRIRAFSPGLPSRSRTRDEPPGLLVVEFEPLVAGQLVNRAFRSLALGLVAAALLMLTAILFWRASLRREGEQRLMEEQRRLSTVGELSAILAHEIRNPLASLKGHAQLLAERTKTDSPERGKVDRIVSEAQRLEALTTDLLDFVRTGPLDIRPVGIEDLLGKVVAEAGTEDVTLDTSEAPESWPLDAHRMRQVFQNLLRNAVEASPEGKPIVIRVARDGKFLSVSFLDQGEGIQEESLERIFEPFFTTRAKGTGLGLAVARRIVELHGGTLKAGNRPEGGAEFQVTLLEKED
jgi:two-component system sensor histidine kinase HydH